MLRKQGVVVRIVQPFFFFFLWSDVGACPVSSTHVFLCTCRFQYWSGSWSWFLCCYVCYSSHFALGASLQLFVMDRARLLWRDFERFGELNQIKYWKVVCTVTEEHLQEFRSGFLSVFPDPSVTKNKKTCTLIESNVVHYVINDGLSVTMHQHLQCHRCECIQTKLL